MAAEDLGTKRTCPKCSAKFYDFGAEAPFTCPKCDHEFFPEVAVYPVAVETPDPKKQPRSLDVVVESDEEMEEEMGGIEALEDFDDEYDENVVGLEEVEDHHEDPEVDPNGDDADDEMFIEDMNDHEKLVDSLDDYREELELDEEEE